MATKKKEAVKKTVKAPAKEVKAPVEEIIETPVVEDVKPEGIWDEGHALIGKRWEMTNETITGILDETDTTWTVSVSDGCTYHLNK